MKEKIDMKLIWNEAGKAGLVLGLISTAYMFITLYDATLFSSKFYSVAMSVVNFFLLAVKVVACIWLFKYFMLKFALRHSGATSGDTWKFGVTAGFLSALIYSAFNLANVAYISPAEYQSVYNEMIAQAAPLMDANSRASAENMIGKLPQITFFLNLVYCFLWGLGLTAIYSPRLALFNGIPGADEEENESDDNHNLS